MLPFKDKSLFRYTFSKPTMVAAFLIAAGFLIFRSAQEHRFIDMVFLLFLTVLCGYRLPKRRWYARSKAESVWFFVLSAYVTFALWGNYFLFVAQSLTWEVIPCAVFACFLSWALLAWMDTLAAAPFNGQATHYWAKWLMLAAIILTPLLLYHEAFNPAITSLDSSEQIAQAIGALNPSDWHSPLYTLFIRFLLTIHPQINFVALVQMVMMACALATCVMSLHRLGVSFYALCIGACVFALLPTNAILINTLWKDVPFSFSLLLLTCGLLRIIEELREPAPRRGVLWRQAVLCGATMAAVFLLRQNGIAPFVGAALVLVALALRYRRWLLIGTLITATLVAGVIKGPVYYDIFHFERAERSSDAKYFALLHDIQGVYYADGDFSENSEKLLDRVIPDINYNWENYNPTWVTDTLYDVQDLSFSQFTGLYLDTLIRNPLLTMRGLLVRCNDYWSILLRDQKLMSVTAYTENYIMEDVFFPEEIEELGFQRRESFFTDALNRLISFSAQGIPASFFWSFGVWTAVLLFTIFHCAFRNKRRILLALVPVICNQAGLTLFSGWRDHRYGYATFLVAIFFVIYALAYRPAGAHR